MSLGLGTTRVISRARILIYWAGSSTGKKAETRPSVDLTNEVDLQHVGTREVSLEHAEEKSTVDRPGLVHTLYILKMKMILNISRD